MSTKAPAYDLEVCLARDQSSVVLARAIVRKALASSMYHGTYDEVTLVAYELVANAIQHGHGSPVLRITGTRSRIRIEVADDSPVLPTQREHGGWGLKVVDRLAEGWGVMRRGDGKVVWCELAARIPATTMP